MNHFVDAFLVMFGAILGGGLAVVIVAQLLKRVLK